jgi:hypothetical protein
LRILLLASAGSRRSIIVAIKVEHVRLSGYLPKTMAFPSPSPGTEPFNNPCISLAAGQGTQMMKFLRRTFSSLPSPIDELPSSAIFGLDRARMILTNATDLNNADEIKTSIGRALEEIEPVFQLAKAASAEQGISDADVHQAHTLELKNGERQEGERAT